MIRNAIATWGVYLVVACFGVGCATPAAERPTEEVSTDQTVTEGPDGPFEAAERWASDFDAESANEAVTDITDAWRRAHVERVWAAGEQYRAVVVQKSTTGEVPAVLLVIARGDDGRWQVVDETPTTSTHIWSEL